MTTNRCNRPAHAVTYFLGRPAAKWHAGLRKQKQRPTRHD
jgi:hypothetical protein